jgi:predicted phosphodiesterase
MQRDQPTEALAGRFCPPDYRLDSTAFLRSAATLSVEVLYVVGGLYGNTEALQLICDAFDKESSKSKCMIFNGDFHWFDISPTEFLAIENKTAHYQRLRGNVETELARPVAEGEDDIGCGCAYPEEVASREVEYSNAIIRQLRETYQSLIAKGQIKTNLSTLPMGARFQLGDVGVAVTHGDIDSLAGWSLAHNRIKPTLENGLANKLDELDVDVVASSHTCLPALNVTNGKLVVNNGSAGLANFQGDTSGLITRISTEHTASSSLSVVYETHLSARADGVRVQALRVPFDDQIWQQKFLAQWPSESAAFESYWKRIRLGTSYKVKQAMQYES